MLGFLLFNIYLFQVACLIYLLTISPMKRAINMHAVWPLPITVTSPL